MESPAPVSGSEHPLLSDRARLDALLDVMHAQIHKTLHPLSSAPRKRGVGPERALVGGVSADDVLQEALDDLLAYPLERVTGSLEALGVDIAKKRAVDARRASQKGLRGTSHRPELRVVSGDAEAQRDNGETTRPVWDVVSGEHASAEDEFLATQSVLDLRDLAREILDGQEQRVFFGIHFEHRTRRDIGEELGKTGQRVGQIYEQAMRRLEAHPRYPYNITHDGQ